MMQHLWHFILFWGVLIAVGSGLLGGVLGATVAVRWFDSRRGLALGILQCANSTGQLIFLPLLWAVILIAGWRGSILVVVSFALILIPFLVFLMRDDPSDVGLEPLGRQVDSPSAPGPQGQGARVAPTPLSMSIFDAIKTPTFWLLCGCFFVCGATSGGLIGTHLFPHAINQGFPGKKVAATIGVMGGMNIVGTILSGMMTDKVSSRKLLAIFYTFRGLSLFVLPYVTTFPGLFLFAVIYGLDWFATVPPTIAIAANTFGRRSFGRVYGWIFLSHQVGSACAAIGAGLLYDFYGNYTLAFIIGGFLGLMAGATALWIPERPQETQGETAATS